MIDWFKKSVVPKKSALTKQVSPTLTGDAPQDDGSSVQLAIDQSEVFKSQGNAYLSMGNHGDAISCFKQAIALNPCFAEAYTNLGIVFQMQNNLGEAIQLYLKAVSLKPNLIPAHLNLGTCLLNLGQMEAAEQSLRRVVDLAPEYGTVLQHAAALQSLGVIATQRGEFAQATILLQSALNLQPDDAGTHNYLANLLYQTGRLAEAEVSFCRVLELQPDFADAHYKLGIVLLELGRLSEAEVFFRNALKLMPELIETYFNLGNLLQQTKRLSEAEAIFLRGVELRPDYAEVHNALGSLYMETKQLSEAEASFRRTLEIYPDSAEANYNLGSLLMIVNRLPEAEVSLRCALKFNPNLPDIPSNLSLLLLSLGRYPEAWPYHEHRYDPKRKRCNYRKPSVAYPQWRGQSLLGKSIIIWPEQGYGDLIQFIRYASLLRERGISRLTVICAASLKPLIESMAGIDAVITESAGIPPHDYWTFPLSIPMYFDTKVDTIPTVNPYLHAIPYRVNRWRDCFPLGKFKVGLVWKGNPEHNNDVFRSLPGLSTLAPLWSVPEVVFISLQKGQGEDELKNPPANQPIIPLGSVINDFADTAAIVELLDLVICVDTAIAHLAGAMGKPCWVLLPAIGTDWRWLREREDSPWYPSLRLFRQADSTNWNQPVERIRQALLALTHS